MSAVIIRIPAVLQPFAEGRSQIATEAVTVGEALRKLCAAHEQLQARLYAPDGRLRRFVNVFVGEVRVRHDDALDTPLPAGAVITILPAVAGG